jgi:hypothetical protein
MKNQTPIEWLEAEVIALESYSIKELRLLFNQAKAMEKEHIMMAFNDGKVNSVLNKRNSEQYYTSTYES